MTLAAWKVDSAGGRPCRAPFASSQEARVSGRMSWRFCLSPNQGSGQRSQQTETRLPRFRRSLARFGRTKYSTHSFRIVPPMATPSTFAACSMSLSPLCGAVQFERICFSRIPYARRTAKNNCRRKGLRWADVFVFGPSLLAQLPLLFNSPKSP